MSPGSGLRIVGHVSTFPPLKCGIASFASDLIAALPAFIHIRHSLHYGGLPVPIERSHANVNSVQSLVNLARNISESECELISLQHEFGIWGGQNGENIHPFLDNLRKPFVSILHTTFDSDVPNKIHRDIVLRIIEQSTRVVVLTSAAKASLQRLYGKEIGNLVVVPHGVPEFPYIAPPPLGTARGGDSAQPLRLISPGFIREDKGIETILQAIHDLRQLGYHFAYRLAGEPQKQFADRAAYRQRLAELIISLNLTSVVSVDDRYLSLAELASAIQLAHVGIFGYRAASQSSSGTVPLVMSMGRPVICTPFEYAKSKSGDGPGVFLAADFDADSIAQAILGFIQINGHESIAKATYDQTRMWTWSSVGRSFAELFCDAIERG
jgi:polysaccharide biosynthesis protein PslF